MNFSQLTSKRVTSTPIVSPSYQLLSPTPGNPGGVFYFGVPQNDILLGYWDTVADRLFKVRNCMNIDGVVRQLPLFAPPIDPALLVRAVAMGVDLSSALSNINAATPRYRFTYMLQKALELCADLKALGSALLVALEKKDAEEMATLRAGQETSLLKAVKAVKEQQIEEVQNTLDALGKSRELAEIRHEYYTSRPFMNEGEIAHLTLSAGASVAHAEIEGIVSAAATAFAAPTVTTGGAGWSSPVALSTTLDGNKLGPAGLSLGKAAEIAVGLMREGAAISATLGGYAQRADERKLQADLAAKDKEQIDKQTVAATIRLAIAGFELANHQKQIDNASANEEFLRSKYTNEELYGWMVTQISTVFFQSYQLAYDMARRAESAFRFERGLTTSDYIHFGYWDSRRSGLLAGEQLHLDLKRLELAYIDQNKRDYEITKQISLMLNDPLALITLKETGLCEIELPEGLFDADYPGHYMRRIKSAGLTIPCVAGPYTSINCTLTLLTNKTRITSVPSSPYTENADGEDDRFVTNFAAMQSIATSHAQNDSGMFELNFRDERYLPFEGAGAISRWRIEMPPDTNAFDLNTLSDVVLHLKYTAREGGEKMKNDARAAMKDAVKNPQTARLARMFSLKHEFPTQWYRFLHPTGGASLELDLTKERFPFLFRGRTITIMLSELQLFLQTQEGANDTTLTISLGQKDIQDLDKPEIAAAPLADLEFNSVGSPIDKLPFCRVDSSIAIPSVLVVAAAKADIENLAQKGIIEDIWIVCQYSVNA